MKLLRLSKIIHKNTYAFLKKKKSIICISAAVLAIFCMHSDPIIWGMIKPKSL